MARKLKAWRHEKELGIFLGASGEVAYYMYVAQKNHNEDEAKRFLFDREDLRNEFFDKYEINAEIAIEIERVDREAWQRAQMA